MEPEVEEQNLLETIVKALVDFPEKVEINLIKGTVSDILEVTPVKEDVGKLVGRQGRTADAIRTIINNAGSKRGKRYILQIID